MVPAGCLAADPSPKIVLGHAPTLSLRSCAHLTCGNMQDVSHTAARKASKSCSGCHGIKLCTQECMRQAWMGHHHAACRLVGRETAERRAG